MRNLAPAFVISLVAACSGNGSHAGDQAKKAGPKHPKSLTAKPSNATQSGMAAVVSPPHEAGDGKTLNVPGNASTAVFAWQADVDDSGNLADCVGAFADDGSAAVACAPISDTCDDGSAIDAGLFIYYDASQDVGAFALVGSNLCGEGYDVVGCTFDGAGNVGDCGSGDIVDDHIDISANG